jgi:hypothetical protein
MSIFEVTPEDIEKLSDADLRTLVAYVAEQEVLLLGQSPAGVTYGGHQNAGDGGIDVRVHLKAGAPNGYVPRLQTGYQVKAEDLGKAGILKEMKPKGILRPSIIELGKAGGAYIIVSSKGTLADTQLSLRRNAMAEAVAGSPDAEQLHLDFYDRRRLATWVNQHVGLIPWVRSRSGKPLSGWQPFKDWSSSPGEVTDEYLLDAGVRLVGVRLKDSGGGLSAGDGVNRVRETLRDTKGVVRLVGLSGVGKTRFVQALFDDRVGTGALPHTSAVYTDVADGPDPLPLDLVTRLHDLGQQCVLVVDNCGVELHRKLAARVRAGKANISLITVEYDVSDDEPEGTDVFKLEPASSEVIERILEKKHPNLSNPEIRTIASFSEGNSRVALALADTARHDESLANLKDSELFKRLFRQKNEDNPALLRAAKVCSLAYSFDGETLSGDDAELPILASIAGQSVEEFHGHIAELHRRQLVQKRSKWRAFLPHALAHRLAKQALEDIPQDTIQQHFTQCAKERLIKSFSRRLGCLHDSPQAQEIVAKWLEPSGWLAETENLNDLGLAVFDNIAPVNPEAIFRAIKTASERIDPSKENSKLVDKLCQLLRALAYEPKYFDEATTLIGQFAGQANPSNRMSDAVNVFQSLFYLYLSGTHAPAEQRAAILLKFASSGSGEGQALALRGLGTMLEAGHFSSSYTFEFGTRKRDYGWRPRSKADLRHWYASAFDLCEQLEAIPALKNEARATFGRGLRTLAERLDIADELVKLSEKFATDGGWPEGWVAVKGAYNAVRKAKRSKDAEKYKVLAERLRPDSLAGRIASYVLPERWSALDIAEIDDGDDKRYEKAQAKVEAICADIGKQLATNGSSLVQHLSTLLRCKSPRVWTVFSAIAQAANDAQAVWYVIVDAFSEIPRGERENAGLCGYVAGLSKADHAAAEALLDDALAKVDLHDSLARMHVAMGVSPRGAQRLIRAVELATVPTWTFANLQLGRACDELSGAQVRPLLAAISKRPDGISEAISIMGMRVFSRRDTKKALDADDKAAGLDLLARLPFTGGRTIEADHVSRIARSCLIAPDDTPLAEQICNRIRESFSKGFNRADQGKLIEALAILFPTTVLDILVEGAESPYEMRRGLFYSYRENQPAPLDKVPEDTLIEWAQSGPEERFVYLADTIRIWTNSDGTSNEEEPGSLTWTSAARKLMAEAPDPRPVLSVIFKRFHPSGWSGSLAEILESRIPLLAQLESHENHVIAAWAKKVLPIHQANIESARESEARESRERDERFEW